MPNDRRRRLTGVGLLIVAPSLAFAACAPAASAPSPSARPAAAAPSAAPAANPTSPAEARLPDAFNALLAVGRSGAANLEVIEATSGHSFLRLPVGAPDASWGHVLRPRPPDGSTIVRTLVVEETSDARELRIDGDWRSPGRRSGPDPGRPVGRRLDLRPRGSRGRIRTRRRPRPAGSRSSTRRSARRSARSSSAGSSSCPVSSTSTRSRPTAPSCTSSSISTTSPAAPTRSDRSTRPRAGWTTPPSPTSGTSTRRWQAGRSPSCGWTAAWSTPCIAGPSTRSSTP